MVKTDSLKNTKKEKNKPKDWYKALNKISIFLDKNKFKFFIDSGTLLGFIRNNDFIEWDNDIDIGILIDGSSLNILLKILKDEYGAILITKYAIYISANGVDVGLNLYHVEESNYVTKYWSTTYENKTQQILIALALTKSKLINKRAYPGLIGEIKNKILNFCANTLPKFWMNNILNKNVIMKKSKVRIEVIGELSEYSNNDIKTYIPEYSKQYLELKYGPKWMVPKKEYNYIIDDRTMSE